MQQKNKSSRFKSLFFTSAWIIPVFFIVPAYIIISLKMHRPVSGNLLLVNNACFAAFLGIRFVWYLTRLRANLRYGADRSVPATARPVQAGAHELQAGLSEAGYRFDKAGRYAEKRDWGYLGTTILYGGLMLLLLVGSYDYMREYSIMVRLGVGLPIPLDGKGLTGEFEAGSLARTQSLPQLQIKRQLLPDAKFPKGATEIALVDREGKVLKSTHLEPGKPFNYGGLDYVMIKYIFDGLIVIREGKYIIFDDFIKFLPMEQKKGVYSYVAPVRSVESKVHGQALLNPEKKAVHVLAKLGDKDIVDTDLELWGENKKTQGEYRTSFEGLAQWSEIRVARERHRGLLGFGAILVLFGGLLRLVSRPQRIWLEQEGASVQVRVAGAQTERVLAATAKG